MKKSQIIVLIIVLAVAIPGIGYGIYYGINLAADEAIEDAEISVNSVEVQSADESSLTVDISGEIENPSPVDATIDPMNLSIGYDGSEFGVTQTTTINAQAGNSTFNQICIVTITDYVQFGIFLTDFISESSVFVDIDGTANVTAAGISITKNISKSVEVDGKTGDLIQSIDLLFITLTITPTFSMTANVNATLYNPFNFAVNITYLEYDVYFDDNDGYTIPFGNSGGILNDIFLGNIEKNYSSSPIEMNSLAQIDIGESLGSSDQEIIERLYSEHILENDLSINIKNGIMHGNIGDFTFEIEFSFSDIPV